MAQGFLRTFKNAWNALSQQWFVAYIFMYEATRCMDSMRKIANV